MLGMCGIWYAYASAIFHNARHVIGFNEISSTQIWCRIHTLAQLKNALNRIATTTARISRIVYFSQGNIFIDAEDTNFFLSITETCREEEAGKHVYVVKSMVFWSGLWITIIAVVHWPLTTGLVPADEFWPKIVSLFYRQIDIYYWCSQRCPFDVLMDKPILGNFIYNTPISLYLAIKVNNSFIIAVPPKSTFN